MVRPQFKRINPEILPYAQIRVSIPRKKLKKLYNKKKYLNRRETILINRKLAEIQRALVGLEHVRSIVERILLRAWGKI